MRSRLMPRSRRFRPKIQDRPASVFSIERPQLKTIARGKFKVGSPSKSTIGVAR